MTLNLLLLAGTGQARRLAQALANMPGIKATASLAGVTRTPAPLALPTRTGGFGGVGGLRDFLRTEHIDILLDATHPFAAQMTAQAASAAHTCGLRHAIVQRPGWRQGQGDHWIWVDHLTEVAGHIAPDQTVFLGTGRQSLPQLAGLAPRRVYARVIDPPVTPFPFSGGSFVQGRPPFSVEAEIALFQRLAIDVLVVKDAGGTESRSKLDAARALGLKVILQRRPPLPEAPVFETETDCMTWIRSQL